MPRRLPPPGRPRRGAEPYPCAGGTNLPPPCHHPDRSPLSHVDLKLNWDLMCNFSKSHICPITNLKEKKSEKMRQNPCCGQSYEWESSQSQVGGSGSWKARGRRMEDGGSVGRSCVGDRGGALPPSCGWVGASPSRSSGRSKGRGFGLEAEEEQLAGCHSAWLLGEPPNPPPPAGELPLRKFRARIRTRWDEASEPRRCGHGAGRRGTHHWETRTSNGWN